MFLSPTGIILEEPLTFTKKKGGCANSHPPPAKPVFIGGLNYIMNLYCEQLKDGRFQYRLRYMDPRTGKMRRVSCIKDSNSRRSYNAAMRELQEKIGTDALGRFTLDAARQMYLRDKARTLKPQTLIRNDNEIKAVNLQLDPLSPLEKLNSLRLREAISAISPENVTYNERLARYKAFLRWCFENELLAADFWSKIKPLPDLKRQRIQDKYLEPDELTKLLDSMRQPLWRYLTSFLVLTGLRIGEAIALERADLDEYITVSKTFSMITRKVGEPKTLDSNRLVYVQPELRELLDRYAVFRLDYCPKSRLLFPGPDGKYLSYEAYNKYLKGHSEKVLGRRITTHALRHTFTSLFGAAGVDLDAISRRLGHANSKVTREIYLHITEAQREKDNNAFAAVSLLP